MKAAKAKEHIPSYYRVPNHRVDGFVGREDILQRIDKALSNGSGPRFAVLQGMGGQGKSQVALEYCSRKKDRPYSAIFWVDATTESSVKGSFLSISDCFKVETDYLPNIEARVAFVLETLTSWTVQWLLVFDNYDNPDTFPNIRNFVPQSALGAILVTSRHPDSQALVITQRNHFIELSGLEVRAAVSLLLQHSQTDEADSSDAKEIVKRLGCHPLAITQAGAYIRKRKLRLSDFMEHYKRRKKIILDSTPQLSQYRKKLGNAEEETSLNVFTTLELSFRQLQSEAPEIGVDAKLLTLLAFFDEKDISEQLFAGFCTYKTMISESTIIWLDAFISKDGQWNSDLFTDALIRLRDSSLLQAFTQGPDKYYHASLHPLVKDWIILRTAKSICRENTCVAGTLVASLLKTSWQNESFDLPLLTRQNITSHIIALEESYQEFFTPEQGTSLNEKILWEYRISQSWFAIFLREVTGLYHLAKIINQRVNAQNEKNLGPEHPNTLNSKADLALIFRKQGWWKESEELGLQVMETRKRVLGLEHPDTLTSMHSLALTTQFQGRPKEAEELGLQVMETRKRVLGLEHPDTLNSMGNLGSTFRDQGRWEEAQKLELQVMETTKRVLGLEHPDTLNSMGNLAMTFENQGRWKEAEKLGLHVIEIRKRVLGLEHPDTLTSMHNLAMSFQNQGRWKEAEELGFQVMETEKRVLGLEHPYTLTSMGNLAFTFQSQGRWKEAEELGLQVIEIGKRVLGLEHPGTLISMGNLALTFQNQGRWKEAEELGLQVMEIGKRVLGLEHPDTLTFMCNLAMTFENQGRWKEAEELGFQVMETEKRVLGLEHPYTLTSMGNLALTFQNQGRWKEAEELGLQVLEMRKRVLGLEHPSTLTSMHNLALTFQNQGRWKETEELGFQVMETEKRVLGLEHPYTLTSMGNLALTFQNQGRWKEAEELGLQVLEMRKRVLGLEHPNTLTSMHNLAWTFWSLDMKKEAIQLMSEVAQIREKKIGSDHPDTVSSIRVLQEWRDGKKAKRLLKWF